MTSAEQLEQKMQELWRKHRPASLARLEVVERAIKALNQGVLTEELRAQATREAHKLAGSLGTFGMAASSIAAQHLESFFSSRNSSLGQKSPPEVNHHFDRLKQEIESR